MEKPASRRGTLVVDLIRTLRTRIESGEFKVGDRLPSEAQLTAEHGVSRTVVREAIAALRSDGLVEPRQGAGVFVMSRRADPGLPFRDIDPTRISSVIEILELRTAIEVEAAGLAALRRTPSQEEKIVECFRRVSALAQGGEPTAEADFELHLAIADGTGNSRFREFLTLMGPNVIPRFALQTAAAGPAPEGYLQMIDTEHKAIVNAILDGDAEAARSAMRLHLEGSQSRYRSLLRNAIQAA